LLDEGTAFVTPTSWNGEVVLRVCIINPLTSVEDLRIIVDSLA
jgi:L-2,4-diaminobutyrate decarboxylase